MPTRKPARSGRHFSLLRTFELADFITLANGAAGMTSVLATMRYLVSFDRRYLWAAFALLPFALLCDFLDGRVARAVGGSSLGAQLDSLADLISFGVAPAALAFAVGMRGGWDGIVLVYFVCCGLSRLARFNVTAAALSDGTGKVRYFEGTPIPTSLVLVTLLAVFVAVDWMHASLPFGVYRLGPWTLHPVVLVFFVSGSAMVSATLRIPKI